MIQRTRSVWISCRDSGLKVQSRRPRATRLSAARVDPLDRERLKSDENHCAGWTSRVAAKDNRRSLIVSGLTILYAVCNTRRPEGAPLFIGIEGKICTHRRLRASPSPLPLSPYSAEFLVRGSVPSRKRSSARSSNLDPFGLMSGPRAFALDAHSSRFALVYSRDSEGSSRHQSQSPPFADTDDRAPFVWLHSTEISPERRAG